LASVKSWNRLPSESAAAYAAFKEYLELPDRSLTKLEQKLNKKRGQLGNWSSKYSWVDRAAAYDSSIVEAERKAKIKRQQSELERQHQLALLGIDKSIEGLMALDPKKMSPYALVQLMEKSCKILNDVNEIENATTAVDKVTSITIKKFEG